METQKEREGEGLGSRSYYVGDTVKLEDVSAKLDSGVLTISIKKRDEKEIEKEHIVKIA